MLITKTNDIIDRLRKEGRVEYINLTPEQLEDQNKIMDEIRRDSIIKQHKSWLHAKDVIINC